MQKLEDTLNVFLAILGGTVVAFCLIAPILWALGLME